jgi:TRAP-type uncharacterized transport system fused permease subunit
LISLILGMGLPGIAIYFMQVTLIVPALVEFGITPIAAHFFIFYFGVFSLITPPVAVAAVAASGIARSSPMVTAWEATKFGVVAYIIPFVFVYSPTLLAQGPPMLVAVNCVTAAVGVLAISVSLRGYLMSPVGPGVRLMLFAAAVGLFVPVDAAPILPYVNAASLVVACLLMGANYVAAQRMTRKTVGA